MFTSSRADPDMQRLVKQTFDKSLLNRILLLYLNYIVTLLSFCVLIWLIMEFPILLFLSCVYSGGLKMTQLQLNCELKSADRGWCPQGLNPRFAVSHRIFLSEFLFVV